MHRNLLPSSIHIIMATTAWKDFPTAVLKTVKLTAEFLATMPFMTLISCMSQGP